MNIIKVDCLPLSIFVGYERENDARGVAFDYSAWTEQYGDGVLQLLVQRPGDADPYPVVLTAGEDGTAVWSPSTTDTAAKGWVEIQLIFMVGSVVAKTAVLQALVDRSLTAGSTPPDPYETWLETLTELAEQILHTTQPPEIRNSYWYIFDPDTGEYVNSGVKAEGEDGVGITGAQLNADYTLTLNFSDGTSYTTPSIRGAQGEVGPTPQLSIGTVTTGAAGSSAAVEIGGTPEAPELNFTIPRGDTGEVSEAELQAALLDKADVITETASGAIASFPDGAAAPVKSLVCYINPVQDLHGYDAPWPAGGGANQWDEEWELGALDTTSGAKNNSSLTIRTKNYISVTPGETYYFVAPIKSQTAAYNGAWVLFYDSNKSVISSGLPSGSQSASNARRFLNQTMKIPSDCHYIMFYMQTAYGKIYTNDIAINYPSTVTTYSPYSNICPISGWSVVNVWDEESYDPTANPKATISLGQTVYGVTLDVVTGVLTITKACDIILSSWDMAVSGTPTDAVTVAQINQAKLSHQIKSSNPQLSSNRFSKNIPSGTPGRMVYGSPSLYFAVPSSELSERSATGLKAWFGSNETQVCYELSPPVTIQLSQQEVLEILHGQNNIWHNANGDVSVEYRADTKLYIEKKITAAIAAALNS